MRIFADRASGGRWDRPELHKLIDHAREGDTIVVVRVDRLPRSLADLLRIIEQIEAKGARFKSLTEAVDTTGPALRMLMHLLGAVVEFERAMTDVPSRETG